MDKMTPAEHKSRLINLAALWYEARQEAANLIGKATAEAHTLEEKARGAFEEAKQAAERAGLLVRHDIATGLAEISPPHKAE